MIRLIHCADIHLGSKVDILIKNKTLDTFQRLADYASDNNIQAVLLSGDVFDLKDPFPRDMDFFLNVIGSVPHIDFIYIRGNHDAETTLPFIPDNLLLFDEENTVYSYEDIDIFASPEHCRFQDHINILMAHGSLTNPLDPCYIPGNSIKNKGIDYIALGHYHSFASGEIDRRCNYCYSGCLQGRGYDETGEKGFVLLEIDKELNFKFIPFAEFTIPRIDFKLDECTGIPQMLARLGEILSPFYKSPMLRLNLTGERSFPIEGIIPMITDRFGKYFTSFSVKDCSSPKLDIDRYLSQISLKGEFVRRILESADLDQKEKNEIITLGLKALAREEVCL